MRSCGRPSSPTAHITFCTLTEVFRPQILIIAIPLARSSVCRPAVLQTRNPGAGMPPAPLALGGGHNVESCTLAECEEDHNGGTSIQASRLLGQHDRDAAAARIGKLGGAR